MSRGEQREINQVLYVTEADMQKIESWPLALRALFDPEVDLELGQRIEHERLTTRPSTSIKNEFPF